MVKDSPKELVDIAEDVYGELHFEDGEYFIRIDTYGMDSNENEDDMFDTINDDIKPKLKDYEIKESWSDHDTQIITFSKREHAE